MRIAMHVRITVTETGKRLIAENKMTIKEKLLRTIKSDIALALKKVGIDEVSPSCEIPPSYELGNLAFPMFKYSSILKDKPFNIASKIQKELSGNSLIKKSEVKGAYLNIFYDIKRVAVELLPDILEKKENFGKLDNQNRKVVLEFSCPNTNKPLHLGHCRNNSLGDSLARILKFAGFDVIKTNLINDRGIHICKSMLAYKMFGNNTTPEHENKKSDHLVGDFYVKYSKESENDPSLEKEAQILLQKWEEGDKEVIRLWEKMNKWAIDGIKETYKRMRIDFDQFEYESINYLYGKEIVSLGLNKNVFYKENDGSVWVNNEDVGLDKKIILRSDGTSIYITQDMGTAAKRQEKYNFDRMIYVVGSEQEYHFKTLFEILKKLGFKWAENCTHLSYGMVNLPEGKMKSREGNVVDADNLIDLLYDMALKILSEKGRDLSEEKKIDVAEKISLAALKYYLLNFSNFKDILFMPEKSISFDGNTGPYIQYTTARLNSLFIKSGLKDIKYDDFIKNYELNDDEINLILQILEYEDSIIKASENYSPMEICAFLYNTARLYNKFYHDNQVLRAENDEIINFRLLLSKAVHILLKNGLNLLGISPLDKM